MLALLAAKPPVSHQPSARNVPACVVAPHPCLSAHPSYPSRAFPLGQAVSDRPEQQVLPAPPRSNPQPSCLPRRLNPHRARRAVAAPLPRFRALALLGRLPSARVDGASCWRPRNLHNTGSMSLSHFALVASVSTARLRSPPIITASAPHTRAVGTDRRCHCRLADLGGLVGYVLSLSRAYSAAGKP